MEWQDREAALFRQIADHHAAGRDQERGEAADRLAQSIMRRTLPPWPRAQFGKLPDPPGRA